MRSAPPCTIRTAHHGDFCRLVAIENDAEAALIEAGVPLPANYPTMSHADLARALAAGWLAVAVVDGGAVGFLAGSEHEGALFVVEINVAHAHQGRGIGRALMAHALARARRRGLWGAMLTTDRFVAFNFDFYRRLGFLPVATATAPPALRAALAREIAFGLATERRVAMVLRFA